MDYAVREHQKGRDRSRKKKQSKEIAPDGKGLTVGGYVESAAAVYTAVQGREDAHHQEQLAKSQMKAALRDAPAVPNAPDTAARDRLRQRQRQNAYGRQDTILTGSIGAPTDASGARRTLLGA